MSKGATNRVDFGGEAPPVEISKMTDGATAGLLREMFAGKAARQAVIVFVRTDVDAPTEYLRYELEGCRIVGFDIASAASDRAVETYRLGYTQMTLIAYAGGHGAKGARSSAVLKNGN
jgi:type VI protein secretion system component Hcp